jgi:dienelactone hydrolase
MTALALLLAASVAAAPAPDAARKVSFPTKDGWMIAALYRPPRKGGAVLVLAHGVGSSKDEWAPLTARLAAEGVGTLALDLRGHVDSRKGPAGERSYETFDADGEWLRAIGDLDAAAAWLKGRGISESRIALGGASIGANLAAQAATTRPKTPFLLLLSAGADYRGVSLAKPLTKTLAGAAPGDGYAHQVLEPLSHLPGVETFEAPAGHGVQMLSDPAVMDKVAAWLAAAARQRSAR